MYDDELYSVNDYRYYLAHHGIENQQWGVRNGPPYPLDRAVSAAVKAGKSAGEIARIAGGKAASVVKSGVKAGAKVLSETAQKSKERHEEHEKAAREKRINKIITSGDVKKVEKNQGLLTNDQYRKAIERINLNTDLETAKNKINLKKVADASNNLSNITGNGIKLWNSFASIYNSLNEDPLPKINGTWFEDQKKERLNKREELNKKTPKPDTTEQTDSKKEPDESKEQEVLSGDVVNGFSMNDAMNAFNKAFSNMSESMNDPIDSEGIDVTINDVIRSGGPVLDQILALPMKDDK